MARTAPPTRLWAVAQVGGLLTTVLLLWGLIVRAEETLKLLWFGIVPVLPATFLLSVQMWRNVCPLATLNTMTGNRFGTHRLPARWVASASVVGVVLLVTMVPARRLVFNTNGSVLAITIALVAVLALVAGFFYQNKAGFCNAICPVLPVERLYGQRPLLDLANPRCTTCNACTGSSCMDLVPTKAAGLLAGKGSPERPWALSGFGLFALGFPGFVVGYFLSSDTGFADAGRVYGVVLLATVASWLLLALVFRLLRTPATQALLVCGALAAGCYYWWAPGTIAVAYSLPVVFVWSTRVVTLGLVVTWLAVGLTASRRRLVQVQVP